MKKKVLITGASGFVGSYLLNSLDESQYDITIINRWHPHLKHIKKKHNFIPIKDADPEWLDKQPKYLFKQDIAVNLLSRTKTLDENTKEIIKVNVNWPIKLLEKLLYSGCNKFIYISSVSVYGNEPIPFTVGITKEKPLAPYALSKAILDKKIQKIKQKNTNLRFISLRYANLYGPGEEKKGKRKSLIGQIIENNLKRKTIKLLQWGQQTRDWLFIHDAVSSIIWSMHEIQNRDCSGIYNIGSGTNITTNELIKIIYKFTNIQPKIEYIPFDNKDKIQCHTLFDIKETREKLGFSPRFNIYQGIKIYVEYLKSITGIS